MERADAITRSASGIRILQRSFDASAILPGYELFQYPDETGERRSIDSADVNEYLREVTGDDFTAKDFRTWAGTVIAIETLGACTPFKTQRQARKNIADAVEKVAGRLGNTVAVCKKCYIHPAVFEAYAARTLPQRNSGKAFVRLLKEWSKPARKLTLEAAFARSVKAIKKESRAVKVRR